MQSSYRLRKPWWRKFSKVINQSRKVINTEFVIFYFPNQLTNHRFGIAVSSKLVKKSVQRHYYKRQVKNILTSFLKENNQLRTFQPKHFDFAIIIRSGFRNQDKFSAKQESLTKLLNLILHKELSLISKKIYA
jgi:ribonuclease P protein component